MRKIVTKKSSYIPALGFAMLAPVFSASAQERKPEPVPHTFVESAKPFLVLKQHGFQRDVVLPAGAAFKINSRLRDEYESRQPVAKFDLGNGSYAFAKGKHGVKIGIVIPLGPRN